MRFKEYGKSFKEIRHQKGISLNHLEELSGVSKATISQFENGKSLLSYEKLEKILEALDVTLRDYSLVTNKGKIEEFILQFQKIECYFINKDEAGLKEIYTQYINKEEQNFRLLALSAKARYDSLSNEECQILEKYFSLGVDWGLFDLYVLSNVVEYISIDLLIDLLDELLSNQNFYSYFRILHDYRDSLMWILIQSCLLLMEKKERFFVQILLRKMERFIAENYLLAKLCLRYLEGCYKYVFVSEKEGSALIMRILEILEELGAIELKHFISYRFNRIKELRNTSDILTQ